jgi:hypothetical protein
VVARDLRKARLDVEQVVDEVALDRVDAEPGPDGLAPWRGPAVGYSMRPFPPEISGRSVPLEGAV